MYSSYEFARVRGANRSTADITAAAIKIQRFFRGYYVRRWLIFSVRAEFQSLVDDIHRRSLLTQFRSKSSSSSSVHTIAQDFNELNTLQSKPVQYQYKHARTLCRPQLSVPPPPPKMKFVSPIPTLMNTAKNHEIERQYQRSAVSPHPSEALSSLHPLTAGISRASSLIESKEEKESLPNLHLSSTMQQLLRDSSLHHADSPPMDGQGGEKRELRAARPALSVGASAMNSSLAPIMSSVHASPALRAATHTMSVGVDTHSMHTNAWVDAVVVSPAPASSPAASSTQLASLSSELMPPLPALPNDSRRPSQSHTPIAGSSDNTILQALAQIGVPSRQHHAYNEHQPGGAHFDASSQQPPPLPRSVVPSPVHPSFRGPAGQQNASAHYPPQSQAVRPLDQQIQSVQAAIQQRLQVMRQQPHQQKPHPAAPAIISAQSIAISSQMSRTTFKTQ